VCSPLNEAMARIHSSGLKVGKVTNVAALASPAMSVVAQTPLRGHLVDVTTPNRIPSRPVSVVWRFSA
jgi:hypothetical protein